MSKTEPRTPAERADELRTSFIECIESYEDEGEPRNVLLSDDMREAVEMFLRPMAEVIEEAGNGHIIGELAIKVVADELPHLTKGAVREALTEYVGGDDDQFPN